jgi:hypothetical protein
MRGGDGRVFCVFGLVCRVFFLFHVETPLKCHKLLASRGRGSRDDEDLAGQRCPLRAATDSAQPHWRAHISAGFSGCCCGHSVQQGTFVLPIG